MIHVDWSTVGQCHDIKVGPAQITDVDHSKKFKSVDSVNSNFITFTIQTKRFHHIAFIFYHWKWWTTSASPLSEESHQPNRKEIEELVMSATNVCYRNLTSFFVNYGFGLCYYYAWPQLVPRTSTPNHNKFTSKRT